MSQWNNKRNSCVTHHITTKLTRNMRRKFKKHQWGWYHHGTSSNEKCKITEKTQIKTSRETASKLRKGICNSQRLQYPLLNSESQKFKATYAKYQLSIQICNNMFPGFFCDIIKMLIKSYQVSNTRAAYIYIHSV